MSNYKNGVVLYDFLLVKGGAEKVTLTLAKEIVDVDLCVGFVNRAILPDEKLVSSKPIEISKYIENNVLRVTKTVIDFYFKTKFLVNYDWVIYSGSCAPTAVHNHPFKKNIYYCHTIPRFSYDLYNYYLGLCKHWQKPLFILFAHWLRKIYEAAINQMDLIIANSNNVKNRIMRYLKKDAIVVYPPCDTRQFRWLDQHNYYVSTARLEPLKRVDLIIEAFRQMPDKKLIVISGGSEFNHLKILASDAPNIHFLGWVSDNQLRHYIGKAIASIYIPKDEDFGMSPIESMAAGKPVIGVAEGGLLETIIPEKTGILLNPNPTAEDVSTAVNKLTAKKALEMRHSCEIQAQLFDKTTFLNTMRELITC